MSSLARWAPRANRVPTGSEHRRDGGLSRSDFLPAVGGGYAVACCTRGVAQFGSALRSGRRGRGFKSRHPDDEETHELAHEVFDEEGVVGRQAEYPEHEVVAVIDGNHFVLEPLYVVGHEVAAMEYWDDGGRAARMGALNQPPDTGKPRSDMDLNI